MKALVRPTLIMQALISAAVKLKVAKLTSRWCLNLGV